MPLLVALLTDELRKIMDPSHEEFVTNDPELFDPIAFPTHDERVEEHARRLKEVPEYTANLWTTAYYTYMLTISTPTPVPPTLPVAKIAMYEYLVAFFGLAKSPLTLVADLVGFVAAFPIFTNLLVFPAFTPGPPPTPVGGPVFTPSIAPSPTAAAAQMAVDIDTWTRTNSRIPVPPGPAVLFG